MITRDVKKEKTNKALIILMSLFLAASLFTVLQAPAAANEISSFFNDDPISIKLSLPETNLRVFSEIPDDLVISDNSVFVVTPDELGDENELDFSLNILPGNTLAMFHLACNCDYESLSVFEKISLKETSVKGIKTALARMAASGTGPGEAFRQALTSSVIQSLRAAAVNDSTYDLASSSMQCQYQIQYVSEDSIGFDSATAVGSDFHIIVLVFFDKVSRQLLF